MFANFPVNKLLPNLYAKQVITLDDKKIMESKPLEKDRMRYLLDDVLLCSLKSNVGLKYDSFVEVLEASDDALAKELFKKVKP